MCLAVGLLLSTFHKMQWYAKAGLRRTWSDLGATILWGEYTEYLDQTGPVALNAGVTGSEFTRWGLGIAQESTRPP
jgi:hypothetical protein